MYGGFSLAADGLWGEGLEGGSVVKYFLSKGEGQSSESQDPQKASTHGTHACNSNAPVLRLGVATGESLAAVGQLICSLL